MNELIKLGKRRTLLISLSILLVSIHTIYFFHVVRPEIDTKKLIQQLIRLLFTFGLLVMVYKGRKWAVTTSIILFSLGLLIGVISLVTIEAPSVNKIPLIVMIFVYLMALYHFGFSKSFKAFHKFQNSEGSESNFEKK